MIDRNESEHVISDIRLFRTIMERDEVEVKLAERCTVTSQFRGKMLVETGEITVVLRTASFIQNQQLNPLSCSKPDEHGIITVVSNRVFILIDRRQISDCLGKICRRDSDSLHTINKVRPEDKCRRKLCSLSKEWKPSSVNNMQAINNIWHKTVGHAIRAAIDHTVKNPSYSVNANIHPEEINCESCVQRNATKQPASGSLVGNSQQMTVPKIVCGFFRQETYGGWHLFVTFTVTSHRYMDVKLIKSQSEVPIHCGNFISWVDRNTGTKSKRVHGDNVHELLGMQKGLQENHLQGHHTHHIYSLQRAVEWVHGTNERQTNGNGQRIVERYKHDMETLWEGIQPRSHTPQ